MSSSSSGKKKKKSKSASLSKSGSKLNVSSAEQEDLEPFHFYAATKSLAKGSRPQYLKAYLNPTDIAELKLCPGDFIFITKLLLITTDQKALGIVWPGSNLLSSNLEACSVLFDNISVSHQDVVKIEKIPLKPVHATSITVNVLDQKILLNDSNFSLYIKEVLIDLEYTIHNQIIEISYLGSSRKLKLYIDQEVESIDTAVVRMTRSTNFNITCQSNTENISTKVSYQAIGGLSRQIESVREMVESSLFHPEKFTDFGLSPPRGLLLYGPPGTGKTLIARAVAAETGAHVIIVNGPEIISKFYGDTEEKLNRIFKEATLKSPTIIFLDEIDALCPNREQSTSDMEKQVVTCLLTLMDGFNMDSISSRPRVVVIGATNRPNALDPALRRPGRFDREFEIGIPKADDRVEILKSLLKPMRHNLNDLEMQEIASKAHGYVGADLSAICREAGLLCIKRVRKTLLIQNDTLLSDSDALVVSYNDMISGMALVKPSVIREISLEIPKVYWQQIGGQSVIKEKLKEAVEWPLKHPEVFLRFNIKPPKGLLLYGPPGCSKTLMAKALATEAGLNFLAVKGPELFSKWVGESEKAVQQIFKKARAASPSIIFFDEIDALAVNRSGDSSVADRVLSQLLSEMDGIEPLVNVTVIAATNRPDIIDSALLRPGRIDSILYVSPPDKDSRKAIFAIQLQKIPTNLSDADIDELASLTEGFSGAETVAVCQTAATLAMQESFDIEHVSKSHFLAAISSTTKRITSEMLLFYKEFSERSGLQCV